jgi:hypothetical protein
MHPLLRAAVATTATFIVTLPVAVHAHHGWTGYESDLFKATGTVDKSSYSNPHGSVHVKTPEKTWLVVLAPPSRMGNRGLTADMLKVGSTVTVEGYRHKTDTSEMRAERIVIDGRTFELR